MTITLKEAFEVVVTLASENILSEREAQEDPEILIPERERQLLALDMTQDFLKTVLS